MSHDLPDDVLKRSAGVADRTRYSRSCASRDHYTHILRVKRKGKTEKNTEARVSFFLFFFSNWLLQDCFGANFRHEVKSRRKGRKRREVMTTRNLEKMLRLTTLSRVCLLRYIGYDFKSIVFRS